MSEANRIDGHTLSWVKSEIDSTMDDARRALEAYVENPEDESQLRFCLNYLHQVYGTLQMVELYGAGMLAQELETVTKALIENQVSNRNDAYEAMMRGMMQLPDYLEKLQSGQADYPIILLPLLNDLRASRSAAFLSESALFSPNLEIQAPAPEEKSSDPVNALISRFRHVYHLGLLDWFRNTDFKMGVKRIAAVIDRLRQSANDPDTSRLLWAASGVAEALKEKGIESSVAVKQLMGQVDRQFKRILDEGEFALSNEPPKDLLKNLLYYVATSNSDGKRVSEIKKAFNLAELMPDTETLERARAHLSAPNAALMKTVSSVLLEDLTQVKDKLDVFVRSDSRDSSVLTELCDKLTQMGDTLDMLGFGEQRMLLKDQIGIMRGMADSEQGVNENLLMDVAGALLQIESALHEPVTQPVEEEVSEEFISDDSIITQFSDPEQRKLVKRVVDEVKVDLSRIKESFNDYTRIPKNVEVLKDVPGLLDRIRGSLSMLTLTRAAGILKHASHYVLSSILAQSVRPDNRTLELLADTISSVEYYLESLTESWGHPSAILDVAERSLTELGVIFTDNAAEALVAEDEEDRQALVDNQESEFGDAEEQTLVDIAMPEFEDEQTYDDITMPEISGFSDIQKEPVAEEPSLELSLEGYDEADDAVDSETVSEDVQQIYPTEEPETQGELSQAFNLPQIEIAEEADETLEAELEPQTIEPTTESVPEPIPVYNQSSLVDELDDEIVEIFLEEAEEEHANISRLLPRWQNNPADEEALKDLRRSFHTLKGSGRLVGASDVGEFAWAYENMLNRVIDRTIEPGPEMYGLLEQARDKLPGLLTLFRSGERPAAEVFQCMQKAEALSKGEVEHIDKLNRDQLEQAITETPEVEETQAVIESDETVQTESADEIEIESIEEPWQAEENEIEIVSGDEEDEFENLAQFELDESDDEEESEIHLDQIEVPEEQSPREVAPPVEIAGLELEIDLEEEEQEPYVINETEEPVFDVSRETTRAQTIDPVLFGIYRKEIGTHLTALREYIDEWQSGGDRSANPKLLRAIHTLKGSSRTASVPQVAEVCGLLEDHLKYLEDYRFNVDAELIDLFEEVGVFIADTIDKLDAAEDLPDNEELLHRTQNLLDKARYDTPTTQLAQPETVLDISAKDVEQAEETETEDSGSLFSLETSNFFTDTSESDDVTTVPEEPSGETSAKEPQRHEFSDADYDEELLEIFLEEGVEILDESDHTLNEWIEEPENVEHVKAIQRQLHTLKGGARMAGVMEIGDLSHSIETMLTAIVDDHLEITDDMFKALQKGQDELVKMLDSVRKQQRLEPATGLIGVINALAKSERYDESLLETYDAGSETATNVASGPQIEDTDITIEPADLDVTQDSIPQTPGNEHDQSEPSISEDLMPAVETRDEAEDRVDFTSHYIAGHDEADNIAPINPSTGTGSELSATSDATTTGQGKDSMSNVVPLGDFQFTYDDDQPQPLETVTDKHPKPKGDLIRVRSDLLDNLVNFAGEVSIYRSRMEQQTNAFRYNLTELDDTVERFREQLRNFEIEAEAQIQYRTEETTAQADFDPLEFDRFTQMQTLSRGMLESLNDLNSLRSILANLTRESETLLLQQSRVNTDLQEGLMRTRMVPISGQIPRVRRIVRQTAEELGKKVELHIEGADNELDRTVLERIMSPIEHMLRNAIAHGIEKPAERVKAGKDETGNITLGFAKEGSDVVITVRDDGAGINFEAIRAKAIERGILKEDADARKEDLLDIILESGFSTADEVTQISGRGVGMDVVNNEIKQLGGLLDTKTESGVGTLFTINMPLSLSVTRALMVTVGEETYAIPLLGVETVERTPRDEIVRMQKEKGATYHWLENEYQYIHLGSAMGLTEIIEPAEDVRHVPLLLVRSGEYRAAIQVDGLIGSREIVVKPVGPQLSTLRGISGATVMGDGSVVLILDLGVLIRLSSIAHEEAFAEQQPSLDDEVVVVEEKRVPLVMVVDDSITVRKVTTRLLERNNYKTISAKDGVDALAQLQDVTPDVMLLDVEMPRMDGFELATNIRNDEVLNKLPIIMITSRTGQKHRDRAMKIGVNIYMGKPYSEGELLENIEELLA